MTRPLETATSQEAADRFVDARFIAKKYKITPRFVLIMAAEGRIPSLRIGRKCIRFNVQAVADTLEGDASTQS